MPPTTLPPKRHTAAVAAEFAIKAAMVTQSPIARQRVTQKPRKHVGALVAIGLAFAVAVSPLVAIWFGW